MLAIRPSKPFSSGHPCTSPWTWTRWFGASLIVSSGLPACVWHGCGGVKQTRQLGAGESVLKTWCYFLFLGWKKQIVEKGESISKLRQVKSSRRGLSPFSHDFQQKKKRQRQKRRPRPKAEGLEVLREKSIGCVFCLFDWCRSWYLYIYI